MLNNKFKCFDMKNYLGHVPGTLYIFVSTSTYNIYTSGCAENTRDVCA